MKKITALLLCILLLCMCSATAFAKEPDDEITDTEISASVPDTHKISITADGTEVFYEGISGEEFVVERLSKPRLLIRAESGKEINSVTLNGTDVTDLLYGGYLELDPVYQDQVIVATSTAAQADSQDSYTVKGKVTLNGRPLPGVKLELRSTLKTTKTDDDGNFTFTGAEPGKHSLTALKDGKVIGYLSFTLKRDTKADVLLAEDGIYTVSVDQNSAGVELHLELHEGKGVLVPTDATTVQKPTLPQEKVSTSFFWWLLLLILVACCIVAFEVYRRKKQK